jgi:glycosyltransferase involved in cell wall biosynthesis
MILSVCLITKLNIKRKGFPTVISEALACEKPVVSTKLSAIPEVVSDECGILMNDPFSPEELATAILLCLKIPCYGKGLVEEEER